MTVRALLDTAQYEVKTIGPKVRVDAIAALLHRNRIGAVPVVDVQDRLVGIVSERDVVAVLATRGVAGLSVGADEIMTRDVVTVASNQSVGQAMAIMTARRIRHLPVVDGGRLTAIISIRDVLRHRLAETETEKNVLRDFAFART